MPRVTLKRKDYKVSDFTKWLKAKMRYEGITQIQLADKLNITQPALSQKMVSGAFTLKDLITIFEVTRAEENEIARLLK